MSTVLDVASVMPVRMLSMKATAPRFPYLSSSHICVTTGNSGVPSNASTVASPCRTTQLKQPILCVSPRIHLEQHGSRSFAITV